MSDAILSEMEKQADWRTGNRGGRRVTTQKDATGMAKRLDPDLLPWERQPDESAEAYEAFVAYRDSLKRRVRDHGATALNWSNKWQWGYRSYQFDRYMDRVDVEEKVRYRRDMDERHRTIARAATLKIAQFINEQLDITKLRPSEAARWLEVAARLERDAAGAGTVELSTVHDEGDATEMTLGEMFQGVDEAKMAELLSQVMGGAGD